MLKIPLLSGIPSSKAGSTSSLQQKYHLFFIQYLPMFYSKFSPTPNFHGMIRNFMVIKAVPFQIQLSQVVSPRSILHRPARCRVAGPRCGAAGGLHWRLRTTTGRLEKDVGPQLWLIYVELCWYMLVFIIIHRYSRVFIIIHSYFSCYS